jgi:hypothetical protein
MLRMTSAIPTPVVTTSTLSAPQPSSSVCYINDRDNLDRHFTTSIGWQFLPSGPSQLSWTSANGIDGNPGMVVGSIAPSYTSSNNFSAIYNTNSGVTPFFTSYFTSRVMYNPSNSLSDISTCVVIHSACNQNYNFRASVLGVVSLILIPILFSYRS